MRATRATLVMGVLGYVLLFGFLLFVFADPGWGRGWILLAVVLVMRGLGSYQLYRTNPALMVERAKLPVQAGQPVADRVLLIAFLASFAGLIAFDALDVFRLRLLPAPPWPASLLGLPMFVAGWWVVNQAVTTNAFATMVVRHQVERAHDVVSRGPYAWVRHPMYAGISMVFPGMGLWLGSLAGTLLSAVPITILVARILLEERFLRCELAGYRDYVQQVRYRLIPGVW